MGVENIFRHPRVNGDRGQANHAYKEELSTPPNLPGSKVDRISSECDFEALKKLIHAREQALGTCCCRFNAGLAGVHHNSIREIGGHDEVVLHNKGGLLAVHDESLDDLSAIDTLLRIQVRAGLIDKVHVCRFTECQNDGKTLQLATRKRLDTVVDDIFDHQWLHYIGNKLRMHIRLPAAFVQELTNRALELGRDFLWLVADIHLGDARLRSFILIAIFLKLDLLVALKKTGQHADKGRFASSILSEEDNNLRIGEASSIDVKDKLGSTSLHCLCHARVPEAAQVVVPGVASLSALRDLEGESIIPKSQVLRRDETSKERIDTDADAEGHGNDAVGSGRAIQDADVVTEIIEHSEIVLNDKNVATASKLALDKLVDHVRRRQALFNVEIGRGLVEHVYVGHLHGDGGDGEALELPAREDAYLAVHDVLQLGFRGGPVEAIPPLLLRALVLHLEDLPDLATDGARNVVNVLRLDRGLEGVLENSSEIVLKLGAAEMDENLFPVRRSVELAEVRLHLASENF